MKKVLALVLSIAIVLSLVILPAATITSAETISTDLAFSDAIKVLDDSIAPRAIRTKVLSDGTVAAVYYRSGSGIYYAESKDGGVSFSEGVQLIGNQTDSKVAAGEIKVSGGINAGETQQAIAKEYVEKYGPYGRGRLEAQNPNLVEMKDGKIAAFYRYNTFETDPTNKPWSMYYASICYQIYDREAGTWGDVEVMYECTQENVVADSGSPYGVWEPDPVYIGDELFCYFADTDLPQNTAFQHIMYCVYDEETGKFGEPAIAQNGIDHNSRDGMSVVTKLNDGTYAMVFESTNTHKNSTVENILGQNEDYITFVIKMSFSKDGRSWTDPVIVAKPNPLEESSTASIEYGVCAAPYVVTLPDGRLAVSYQTTDRYTGRTPNRVSYRIGTQVAVSSQAITYDTFASNEIDDDVTSYFSTELNPGVLGENEFSKSAQLMVKDDRLYVYYSEGSNSWTTVDGVEKESHDFGDVKMAYINLATSEDALDGTDIDNYIVYNSGGKDVTVNDDGSFGFVAGATNMIYGSTEYVENKPAHAVNISYDAADYTTNGQSGYAFTTDADAKTLNFTTGKQAKAMFDYVADAKMLDMDVTMLGNSEGTIWGGVAFHVQESDFAEAAFNTAGYSVYLVRSKSTLNKLTLYVRYCTEGGVNAHTYQPVLTTALPTDKDLKLRLQVSVGEKTFTVKALSEDGLTQYGATKTYNLDATADSTDTADTKYYSTGKVALIANGAHTFSNISITRTTDEVEVAYNAENYTTNGQSGYAFSADLDAKTLNFTTGKQAKAMLDYVADAKMLDTDVTMLGNLEGTIWGGVAFHVQESDFAEAAFNTAGYSVYLVRSKSTLNKLTLYVRYCTEGGVNAHTYQPVLTTALPTDKDLKLRLQVSVGEQTFTVKALSEDGLTQYGDTKTYNLDATADSTDTADTKYYSTGKVALIVNGVHTFSNISIKKNSGYTRVDDITRAENLDAHAAITFPETVNESNQVGMSFRVQQGADASPGITGYVLKLLQTTDGDSNIKVQLTRYGTNSAGEENKNLGDMYTEEVETVLGNKSEIGSTILMDAKLRENILYVTLTNATDVSLTSSYEFDLTKASGSYDTYYEEGGFGFFKNGDATEITISDVKFAKAGTSIEKMDTSKYTVYCPDGQKAAYAQGNTFVADEPAANRIILNDTVVGDFKASAIFESGVDGNLNSAIVFRTQNIGTETDEREGYALSVWKSVANSGDYSRAVLLLYKWGIDVNGNQKYLGEVARLVDTTTIKSVYPESKNSLLAGAGIHIKLNAEVKGTQVIASFDVLDEFNNVAASSETATFNLTAKTFASEADATVYNAGQIGVSMGQMGKVCDFELETDGLGMSDTDVNDYEIYSSNANTMVIDNVNDKIYSITTGHKQAVLKGRNTNEFDITATLKSTKAGATYNFGYDFAINEDTHSKTCAAGASTTYMFEGYRVQLTRATTEGGDLSHANLRLYKFERVDNGDGTYSNKRTELKNVANADFFADYDEAGYGNVETVLNVTLQDGVLTAKAYVKDYPTRTLEYTYTEGMDTAEGTIGWYVEGGGSITMNNIKLDDLDKQLITSAACENGKVYAVVNSGAAAVGDTVKIRPVAADGYEVDEVSYTVNGVKTVVEAVDGEYTFAKPYGATEIASTFAEKALVGDIDGDGLINGSDIAILRKILLNKYDAEYDEEIADCHVDGIIDIRDLVNLKKTVGGA